MQPSPLYNGNLIAVPQAFHTEAQEKSPFADLLAQGNQARTAMLDQLDATITDTYEYSLEQNRAAQTRQIESDIRSSLIERMALAPGHKDSFFDRNGIYLKAKAENFMNTQLSRLDGLDKGFITQNARRNAAEANAKTRDALDIMMKSTILRSIQQQAEQGVKRNYDLAMKQGDYTAAGAIARESAKNGIQTEQEAEIMALDADKAATIRDIDAAAQAGDKAALYRYAKAAFIDTSINDHAEQRLQELNRKTRAATLQPLTLEQQDKLNNQQQDKQNAKTSKYKDNLATLRPGIPKELRDLYLKHKGVFKNNPAAVQDAEQHAASIATSMILSLDPTEAENFKQSMTALGVSASHLDNIIKERREQISAATEVDTKKLFDNLPALNVFNAENKAKVEAWQKEYNTISAQAMEDNKNGITTDPATKAYIQDLKDTLNRWNRYEKEAREKMYADINGQYTNWLLQEKEKSNGKAPDASVRATKFFNLADSYLKEKVKRTWEGEFGNTYTRQVAANAKRLEQQRQTAAIDRLNTSVSTAGDAIRTALKPKQKPKQKPITAADFARNAKDHYLTDVVDEAIIPQLPDFDTANAVYVPKGTKTADQLIVELPNGYVTEAKVYETEHVTEPVLSDYLKADIGTKIQYNTISLYKNRAIIHYREPYGLFPEDDGVDPQGAQDIEEATQVSDEYPLGNFLQNY